MSGKIRPAVCVFVAPCGAAALCPGTSRKSAQPGAVAVSGVALERAPIKWGPVDGERARQNKRLERPTDPARSADALGRATWLLAPLATLFPADWEKRADFSKIGSIAPGDLERLIAQLSSFYGADWRASFAKRAAPMTRPTRIAPLGRIERARKQAGRL